MKEGSQAISDYFSDVCVNSCKALCCKPWWGIIAYSAGKDGSAGGAAQFRAELLKGLRARCARIMDAYITNERPPRRLFKPPQRYNLLLKNAQKTATGFKLDLIAMFAFECLYLANDHSCSIHPTLNAGRDIRPPHCAALGAPDAAEGEAGYCRIIRAAAISRNADAHGRNEAITTAVEFEKNTSDRHYANGFATAEEAVDAVMERIKEYIPDTEQSNTGNTASVRVGRNDPCPCGSGQKFKKCHGKG